MKDKKLHKPIIIIVTKRLNISNTINNRQSSNIRIYSLVQNKSFIKHLMSLYFQNKFIQFTLDNMSQFDEKMIKVKDKFIKIYISENGTVLNQFHFKKYLVHLIVYQFGQMDKKMFMEEFNSNIIA